MISSTSVSYGILLLQRPLDILYSSQGERSPAQVFSVYQYNLIGKLEFETLYVEKGDATGIYMEFATHPPISVNPGQPSRLQPGGTPLLFN